MVWSYMEEPGSSSEAKLISNFSDHHHGATRSPPRLIRRKNRRDSGNGMILDIENAGSIQPPPYTVTQITTTSNISKGALGRKLSDLLLDKEFMPPPSPPPPSPPPPSPPPLSSGKSNGVRLPNVNHLYDNTSTTDENDGLANPIMREATPAETNAFSRILLPKNVVPRLLRMLQDNLQPKKRDGSSTSQTSTTNAFLLPRMVVFASHVSAADKVYRLVEYTFRLLAYLSYLQLSKVQGRKFLNLAMALADTRAGMRLLGLLMVADRFHSLFGYKLLPFSNISHSSANRRSSPTKIHHTSFLSPSSIQPHHFHRHHHQQLSSSEEAGLSADSMANASHSSIMSASLSASMSSSTMSHPANSMLVDPMSVSLNSSNAPNTSSHSPTPPILTREEKMVKALEAWQTILLAFHYPLDHMRWLARHKAITMQNDTAKSISRYASAFWSAYLLLDLVSNVINLCKSNRQVSMVLRQATLLKLAREHTGGNYRNTVLLSNTHNRNSSQTSYNVDVSEEQAMLKRELETYLVQRADWFWRMMGNVGDLPIAVDATLPNGMLPQGVSSVLGIVGSGVAIYTRWRSIHGVADTIV